MQGTVETVLILVSLRSKRFQSSYRAKVRAEAKKKVEGGGGGEKRKRLPANPTILENSGVCGQAVPSFPSPSPVIHFFFALVPAFLTNLARKRLLRRLDTSLFDTNLSSEIGRNFVHMYLILRLNKKNFSG